MNEEVHRRSITVRSCVEGEFLNVLSRLCDERPWSDQVPILHDMELELQVRVETLVIESSIATMHAFPHDECPFISPKFAELAGVSVTRGFSRRLRELFAGASGCQHLHELARVTGPAVFQAKSSLRAQLRLESAEPIDPAVRLAGSPLGSCHVWAVGGAAEQKVRLGWQPGTTRYPTPSAEELRRERDAAR